MIISHHFSFIINQIGKERKLQHQVERDNNRYHIVFDNITILNCTSHYEGRIFKEAIEIKLENNNFNKDFRLILSYT